MRFWLRVVSGSLAMAAIFMQTACGSVAPTAIAPTVLPAATVASPAPLPLTGKLKIVATFSVLGDFAQNVAGDKAEVKTLVGLGSDVHEFEPSPSDEVSLMNANVVVENGVGLETWLDTLYASSGSKAARVVAGQGIPTRKLVTDSREELDPHIWQNVTNAITMVQTIRDGLIKADPPNTQAYQANAAAYIGQLRALDQNILNEVSKLPKENRKLVTSHDALGYYADRYGFQIVGSLLGTVATASGDPSAKDFAQLLTDIKAAGVKAVFVESVANPATMDRLAHEAGVKIGPELYTDSLGAAGSPGDTYLAAMRHNTVSIVSALLGQ